MARLALCAFALSGCPRATAPADGGLLEAGRRDGILPPDIRITEAGWSGSPGTPCNLDSGTGCSGQSVCLTVGLGVGVCALPGCTVEDLTTPQIEDNCPTGTACTRVLVSPPGSPPTTQAFCLRTCVPSSTSNPCKDLHPRLACDPASILYNGHRPVCLFAACQRDGQCGNGSDVKPDSVCDPLLGLCFPRGTENAKVGASCRVSGECGRGQFCLGERHVATGGLEAAGGYCTVIGCHHGAPWGCPTGSTCVVLGSSQALSMCLATGCNPRAPTESDGCRDEARGGQYECVPLGSQAVCWVRYSPQPN